MKSQFKLYDISDVLRQALDAAQEYINDETGEIPEDWAEFLDTCQVERDTKVVQCALMARELKAESEAIANEAKRLMARSRSCASQYDRLRDYIAYNMQAGEKLKDERVSLSCREIDSVNVVNESVIPEEYWKLTRTVKKADINSAIKSGKSVPGTVIEKKKSITIR